VRSLPLFDLAVLLFYLVGVVAFGCWFARRSRSTEGFMAAGRSMPGWLVGLSIFGTYVSSISFLALPGKAFAADWSPFALSLSLPVAALVATRWFVPFYRRSGEVSAYSHLEHRFGPWARTYTVICYLLTQVSRMGSVMYLLGLPLHHLLGWDIRLIIVVTGVLTAIYTSLGGIEGVIWTDAVQSLILIAGAVSCMLIIPFSMPEGPTQMFRIAMEYGKFSLGSFGPSLTQATFWVILVYGLFINLQNFGIDQCYVQRYHTARSDREANKSVWLGALLYIPVSAFFFFIGTALFAYYTAQPERLPTDLQAQIAAGKGDNVFPFFIVSQLPTGFTGLLVAAIFAAAMSTLSGSLNGAATLTLTDLYKRFVRPAASERESMIVLYTSTLAWGVVGTGTALAMIHVQSALDAYWKLASIFSGGMLGLFLLGLIARRAKNAAAATGVIVGLLVIFWMALSPGSTRLPEALRSPLHEFLVIVIGTMTILLVGFLVSWLFGSKPDAVRGEK
jgi:SSS family solute:Na+ symporter